MNFLAGERASMSEIRGVMQRYLDAYAASGKKSLAGRDEPLRGVVKRIFIADSHDEAMSRAHEAWDAYRSHFAKPLPGGRIDPDEIPIPAKIEFESALANESLLVGTAASVRDYVRQFEAEAGANYLVTSFQWGDLTHEEAMRSLQAFAGEVMPAVSARH
jgi:alkanesulfonate monooxygenase SsuD/methylene tetrahydromethanopterin reductase-like flavin-dependent oxidoreductase (luciferase family)